MSQTRYNVTRYTGLYRLLLGDSRAWSLHGLASRVAGKTILVADAVRIFEHIYSESAITLGESARIDIELVTGFPTVTASRPGFDGNYVVGVYDINTGLLKMVRCYDSCESFEFGPGVQVYDVVKFSNIYVLLDANGKLYAYVNNSLVNLGYSDEVRAVYKSSKVYASGDYVWSIDESGNVQKLVESCGAYRVCMWNGDVYAVDANTGRLINIETGESMQLPGSVVGPGGESIGVSSVYDCGSLYYGSRRLTLTFKLGSKYVVGVLTEDLGGVEEWVRVEDKAYFTHVEYVYRCMGSSCTDSGAMLVVV